MKTKLPEDWKIKKIKEFTRVITGGTPSTTKNEYWDNGTVPWIPSGDLKNKSIHQAHLFITEKGLKNSSAKIMPKKTVLIALTGATTGQTGILELEASANQSVTGILPSNEHHPEYLFYFLQTQRKKIIDESYGGAQPHISQGYVKELEIILPPLLIQQKIVSILEKAEKLKKIRKEADELTKKYLKSVFLDMFGDITKNTKKWELKPFEYFAKIDTIMTTDFPKYGDKPHIGIENIEQDTGKLINYRNVGEQHLISGKYLFTKNHIIYSKIRPNLNKVALPNFDGLCSADAYPFLVTKNTNRYFFSFILRSELFLNYILKHSRRANIPKANKDQIKQFHCINPPLELQNKFASIVHEIETLKEFQKQSEEQIDTLFNNSMQKAFKGELVC